MRGVVYPFSTASTICVCGLNSECVVLLFRSEFKNTLMVLMTGVPSFGLAIIMILFIFDSIGLFCSLACRSAFCAIMPPAECATNVMVSNWDVVFSSSAISCLAFSSMLSVNG